MNFLVNYTSIFDKEWFRGLLTLLGDILLIGFALLFLLCIVYSIIVWFIDR